MVIYGRVRLMARVNVWAIIHVLLYITHVYAHACKHNQMYALKAQTSVHAQMQQNVHYSQLSR